MLFLCGPTVLAQKVQTGKASFYADKFEGRTTASGEIFSQSKLTAAHKTLPFGTNVKVTNLANNKSVVVIVNDRGPFVPGRIIDLSLAAAKILGFIDTGVTDVTVEVLAENDEFLVLDQKIQEKEPAPAPAQFYHLETKRTSPQGFAVQVGSFEESSNLLHLADQLKTTYGKEVTVQIKNVQETNIFSLMIGSFKERKKAEKFKEKVAKKYPGSFVVDFSEINNASN